MSKTDTSKQGTSLAIYTIPFKDFSLTYALRQKVSVKFNLDNVYYQHNPLCTGRGAVVVWDNSAFLRDFSLVYLELAVA
jgi:hypothetical protein